MSRQPPPHPVPGLGKDELQRRAGEAMAARPDRDGVWLFAYGALMWDDSFRADAAHPATLGGFERSYCIWDERNRGTPKQRSLTLGLTPGPSGCTGLAMHLREADLATEFPKVWQHEMPGGYYQARWVSVDTKAVGTVWALTFVADPGHPMFAGDMPDAVVAGILSVTNGEGGAAREYLDRTAAALTAAGVPDRRLDGLVHTVAALPRAA